MGLFVPACITLSFRHLARPGAPLPLGPLPLPRQVEKEEQSDLAPRPPAPPPARSRRRNSPIRIATGSARSQRAFWFPTCPRLCRRAPASPIRPFASLIPWPTPAASRVFGSPPAPAFAGAFPRPGFAHSHHQSLYPAQSYVCLNLGPRSWLRALAARVLVPHPPPPLPAHFGRHNWPIRTANPLAHPCRMSTSILDPPAGSARSHRSFWFLTRPRLFRRASAAIIGPPAPPIPCPTPATCLPQFWTPQLAPRARRARFGSGPPPPSPTCSRLPHSPIRTASPFIHPSRMSTSILDPVAGSARLQRARFGSRLAVGSVTLPVALSHTSYLHASAPY
ncbi:hypothetical protein B0H19DRAFT_1378896 [Mycena capillaripes]|nr:hypothetical protein B0H19DRAFT_1378896 [Mycena capillaripes]